MMKKMWEVGVETHMKIGTVTVDMESHVFLEK